MQAEFTRECAERRRIEGENLKSEGDRINRELAAAQAKLAQMLKK
jgi:hypothetical protein